MLVIPLHGQNERKVIRDGIRAYEEEKFAEAEVEFRKAGSINQELFEAEFNTGAALYAQDKYEETTKQYESLLSQTDDDEKTASIWHNIGNSLLEAEQYAPSIEAYKNSLRKNPTDDDTRYNLAYAKQKLKEQQQENQDTDLDQNKEQDKEQDEGQDQQDQEQDKNQDHQEQDQQDQDQQDQQDQDKNQEQQAAPREISKEDAERMLKAIQQQEKDVKEKVDKKKAAAAKVKTEKDW